MSKRTIISICLVIVMLIAVFLLLEEYKPDIDRIKSTMTISDSVFTGGGRGDEMVSIYTDIHHMSHNVVIADDKWGYKDLTLENIEILIEKVTKIEDQEDAKEEILEILTRWKNGEFSKVHYDHNYVWGKLGGTVGRATGVNKQYLPDWAIE